MRIAFFDCFSGICGDMILGAFFDLGLDLSFFKTEMEKLDISGYKIDVKKAEINGYKASDVYINIKDSQPPRTFMDIKQLIENSNLNEKVKELSMRIFHRLAVAEGKVHKTPVEKVHFHEVGAVDSIIDIVGSAIGIEKLGIKQVYSSELPLGSGFVKCEHGLLSVPVPATRELLKGIPVYQTDRKQELITPTGAAFISTVAKGFGNIPNMKIIKTGYGKGKKEGDTPPILKIVLGEINI